jgi:hypothetical protein
LRPFLHFRGGEARILYWVVVATSSGLAVLAMAWILRRLWDRVGTPASLPWLLLAVIGATPVLPFARTYNDHVVEAAIALGMFALLFAARRSTSLVPPLGLGALAGVLWWLHPLTGTVIGGVTGLTLLLPAANESGGESPARRGRAGPGTRHVRGARALAGFAVGGLACLAAGGGLHQALYGRVTPFYFSPETYFWTGGPGGVESAWLEEPKQPGLSDEALRGRLRAIGLDRSRVERTMTLRARYLREVASPATFALRRFFDYGQLTFTPLVIVCLVLVVHAALRRGFRYRREWLWALACLAGLYAAAILLRAVAGNSFGNRHLLPALPAVVFAGFASARHETDRALLKLTTLAGLSVMAAGMMGPWTTPGPAFLVVNACLSATLLVVALLAWRSPENGRVAARIRAIAGAGRTRLTLATAGLALGETALFLASLPVTLRAPL